MSVENVLKMMKDHAVEFVDLRFADMAGKHHHVSFPAKTIDPGTFEDGKMFDGSSIAGWKGINESDMVLLPDPASAMLDPFTDDPTLILHCDVLEPATMQSYARCPRGAAKRAEAFLKSTGIADAAFFGPEPEFFIFDSVRWRNEMAAASFEIESEEAAWSSNRKYEGGNTGHRPGVKGGYFPVSPVDSFQDLRSEICKVLETLGIPVEVHHHEVATAGQCEIGTRFNTLVRKADELLAAAVESVLLAGAPGEAWPFALRARRRRVTLEPLPDRMLREEIPAETRELAGRQLKAIERLRDDAAAAAFERLWAETGCRTVIEDVARERKHGFALERAIFLTVLHRLMGGGSDLSADRWRADYAISGIDGIELQHLYRAMAWLGEELVERVLRGRGLADRAAGDVHRRGVEDEAVGFGAHDGAVDQRPRLDEAAGPHGRRGIDAR